MNFAPFFFFTKAKVKGLWIQLGIFCLYEKNQMKQHCKSTVPGFIVWRNSDHVINDKKMKSLINSADL